MTFTRLWRAVLPDVRESTLLLEEQYTQGMAENYEIPTTRSNYHSLFHKLTFNIKYSFCLLLLSCLCGCAHELILPGDPNDAGKKRLTLIHFNDGESHLLNAGSGFEDYGGIARFTTVIKNIRNDIESDLSTTSSLTVSAGNNFLAGPVFNVSRRRGVPYYDAVALDMLGVDAFALGSRDFEFGPDVLASFIESFNRIKPLFLSANIDVTGEPELCRLKSAHKLADAAILRKGGEKFGIIGVTDPDLKNVASPRRVKISDNLVGIVQKTVDHLQKAGIKRIILVSNLSGIDKNIDIIKQIHGLDIVVAGGGGELLCQDTDLFKNLPGGKDISGIYPLYVKDADNRNVPLVTTPGKYCYVGRLDVVFDSNGEVAEVLPVSKTERVIGDDLPGAVEPDREINEKIVIPLAKAITTSAQSVGVTDVLLDGEKEHLCSGETNLGDLVADSVLWSARRAASLFNAKKPDIAIINGYTIQNSIAKGQISDVNIFAASPVYRFITVVEDISPDKLKDLLEKSLTDALSATAPDNKRYFPQLSNFSIVYNPTRADNHRIKEIKLKSGDFIVRNYKVVQYAPYINIATQNCAKHSGVKWGLSGDRKVNIGILLQNALIDYISAPLSEGGLNKKILKKRYPQEGLNRIMLTRE